MVDNKVQYDRRNYDFSSVAGWLTQSLLYEARHGLDDHSALIFTNKNEDIVVDGKTYFSLYKLYMRYDDPTEYQFATEVLGGWEHWKAFQKTPQLAKRLVKWREETSVRTMYNSVQNIITQSNDVEKPSFQANKFLVDKGWIPKAPTKGAGRPSKKVIAQNLKEINKVKSILKNDVAMMADYKKAK